jgi:hypothetical protein
MDYPINMPPDKPVRKWGESKQVPRHDAVKPDPRRDDDLIGAIVDAYVIDWHGTSGWAVVSFRFPRVSLYINQKEVITLGEITKGTKLRCLVAAPQPPHKNLQAMNIEIYVPETENSQEKQ